jgi:hypothetical protein
MYFDYPEVKRSDRLAHAQSIDAARVRLSAAEAWTSLHAKGEPDEVHLSMFDGRPAYWFSLGKARAAVYADNGQAQTRFPADLNLRTAAAWTGQPPGAAKVEPMVAEDQWTVGGLHYNYEPLTKYSWPNGDQVYIPAATGQVVQSTTALSRLGAWLGPIPHWLYFTPLRKNAQLWSRIVIWLSGLASAVAVLGLIAGLSMYSPRRRYRAGGVPTSIPYSGPKRLHMILGLFFGFIACAWAFSGMLSMDPFPVKIQGEDPHIPEAFSGDPFRFESFAAKHPRDALRQASASIGVKEIEFVTLAGESAYLATQDERNTRVIPVMGEAKAEFDRARIMAVVARASGPAGLAEARFIDRYDAHYLDRRQELPLPVLLVRMKDAQQSTFYIDPRTARIVGSYSSGRWAERWVYHGLHSINLPWLYNHRPAWDIVVLALMLGGASLSITAVMIGWQLLARRLLRQRF